MKSVDDLIGQIPDMSDGLYQVRVDHAYSQMLMKFCEFLPANTLGQLLAQGNGHFFCSTEVFQPCPGVYELDRVDTTILPPGNAEYSVVLDYSTEHIRSTTLRDELHDGATLSVVATFRRKDENTLRFQPLVMGGPWMSHEDERVAAWAMWEAQTHFENFVEDFEQFKNVLNVGKPADSSPMKHVSELAFKTCLAKLLGDPVKKDWGGEMSDHFTCHLNLMGRRVSGAFLLKGPARFQPMTLNQLGKNNDQIYRLSQEPADVLFVQHCHEIESAVRATLRAFAVQPGRPRRYCLIDGRDSLWLLRAYGLYDEAVALTQSQSAG